MKLVTFILRLARENQTWGWCVSRASCVASAIGSLALRKAIQDLPSP